MQSGAGKAIFLFHPSPVSGWELSWFHPISSVPVAGQEEKTTTSRHKCHFLPRDTSIQSSHPSQPLACCAGECLPDKDTRESLVHVSLVSLTLSKVLLAAVGSDAWFLLGVFLRARDVEGRSGSRITLFLSVCFTQPCCFKNNQVLGLDLENEMKLRSVS